MTQMLCDEFGRKVKVLARVDGKPRRVVSLQFVKPDYRGRIHLGPETADQYVLVMVMQPDLDRDGDFFKPVKSKEGLHGGDDEEK